MYKSYLFLFSLFFSFGSVRATTLHGLDQISQISGIPQDLVEKTIAQAEAVVKPLSGKFFTKTAIDHLTEEELYSLMLIHVLANRESVSLVPLHQRRWFLVCSALTICVVSGLAGAAFAAYRDQRRRA